MSTNMHTPDQAENLRHEKVIAEIAKLTAETMQINQGMKWYVPVLIATGGAGAMTLAILFARFILIEYQIPIPS